MKHPLVVYDSGLGGLSLIHYLKKRVNADVSYFIDNKNFPYGSKSMEQLIPIVKANLETLMATHEVVIIACNTASMVYLDHLPHHPSILPIIDRTIVDVEENQKAIGIIGTNRLIVSGSYQKRLVDKGFDEIIALPSNRLVQMIEHIENKSRLAAYIEAYFQVFKAYQIRQLVLACTHFNWLIDLIDDYFHHEVRLVSSGYGVIDDYCLNHAIATNSKQMIDRLLLSEENARMNEKIGLFSSFNHNFA